MTPADHDLPLDDEPLDDDTLAVHAVVDDEATPEQRRQVARDPALVAQVAQLRAVVAAVAVVPDPPADDVLAAIRARALDEALSPAAPSAPSAPEPDTVAAPDEPAHPSAPVRDLGAARERRARQLPPLPAVAAVVVLLVLVGVGLIVVGSGGGSDDEASDSGGAGTETAALDEGDDGSGGDSGGESEATVANDSAEGFQQELLDRATARYATGDELLDDLREVDPRGLALGETTSGTDDEDAPATTTAPTPSDDDPSASTTTTGAQEDQPFATSARAAQAFASDPAVQRCDAVLRAGEPDLEPATAAVAVEVDGLAVLVLSNPTEPTERAPEGIRLTALNAVDCIPLGAVVR